ncbi:MAG: TnpV protein [Oscillospiraceae bacterium]|nr:TnpV protein [Oscillospiraceae bacterium]
MKTIYEQLGGRYSRVGDYYLPNMDIKTTEQSEGHLKKIHSLASGAEPDTGWIGKYGLMRKTYLKEHRPVLYEELLRTARLYEHLAEVNEICSRQVEQMATQMAKHEGVNETLKAANPMAWVARMNSIQNRAEEIVLREYVFA